MLPIRHKNHVIDTRAVRTVLTRLDENWLVRGLEERDYGIDLSIEVFDEEEPTGETALVQVKGTLSSFGAPVTLSFPTKTIHYALLFQVPFFVFYVSLESNSIRYVWLQRYARIILDEENPEWRGRENVTIHFPEENDFKDGSKLREFLRHYACRDEALRARAISDAVREVVHDKKFLSNRKTIEYVEKHLGGLNYCKKFLDHYGHGEIDINCGKKSLTEMKYIITSYEDEEVDNLSMIEHDNSEYAKEIDILIRRVDLCYDIFSEDAVGNAFFDRMSGYSPF